MFLKSLVFRVGSCESLFVFCPFSLVLSAIRISTSDHPSLYFQILLSNRNEFLSHDNNTLHGIKLKKIQLCGNISKIQSQNRTNRYPLPSYTDCSLLVLVGPCCSSFLLSVLWCVYVFCMCLVPGHHVLFIAHVVNLSNYFCTGNHH